MHYDEVATTAKVAAHVKEIQEAVRCAEGQNIVDATTTRALPKKSLSKMSVVAVQLIAER